MSRENATNAAEGTGQSNQKRGRGSEEVHINPKDLITSKNLTRQQLEKFAAKHKATSYLKLLRLSKRQFGAIADEDIKEEYKKAIRLFVEGFGAVADKWVAYKMTIGHARASAMLGKTTVKYAFDNVEGLRDKLAKLGVNEKLMYVLLHALGARNRTTAMLLLMQWWIEMTCLFAADLLQVMIHLAETGECGPEIRLRIAELSRLSLNRYSAHRLYFSRACSYGCWQGPVAARYCSRQVRSVGPQHGHCYWVCDPGPFRPPQGRAGQKAVHRPIQ